MPLYFAFILYSMFVYEKHDEFYVFDNELIKWNIRIPFMAQVMIHKNE